MGSKKLKDEIILALSHPEAEAGLYLTNLIAVHEDEERPVVSGTDLEVLDALKDLIADGLVEIDDLGENVAFRLKA